MLLKGFVRFLLMSRYVINPSNVPSPLTTGSFSILLRCKMTSACSIVVFSAAVTKPSAVITSPTLRVSSCSKRRSRLVMIPINFFAESTTGIPPMRYSAINFLASPILASLVRVTGSKIIPDSARFTLRTSIAWRSAVKFL